MNPIRILALALIIGGAFSLIYGGFSYTRDTTAVKLGPVELKVQEKQTVNVPVWAGFAALGIGAFLLIAANRK